MSGVTFRDLWILYPSLVQAVVFSYSSCRLLPFLIVISSEISGWHPNSHPLSPSPLRMGKLKFRKKNPSPEFTREPRAMVQGLKETMASSDTYSVLSGGRMNLIVLTGSQTFSPKSTCPLLPKYLAQWPVQFYAFLLKILLLFVLCATALKTWNV